MKLNLACGDDYREGYINIDVRVDAKFDILASVDKLPYGEGSIDEIVAQDILEHFPRSKTLDLLAEWRRVLKVGGKLNLRVPNMAALAALLLGGVGPLGNHHITHSARATTDLVIENIYGGHRWGPDGVYDAHHWGWTLASMRVDLEKAGFAVVSQDAMPNFYTYAIKTGRNL